jgi:4-amino-4-deoxy-L-arabinose transferase-like glycosyltransferase
MNASTRRRLALAALFCGAFALRAGFVVAIFDDPIRYPVLDAHAYHEWALRILDGDWLGNEVYYQDPLYPFFLAGLYAVFGPDTLAVVLAQAALGAGTVTLLAAIGWRLFGAAPALIAGVFAALYAPALYYEALLLKAPLLLFLFTALALALVRAAESARPAPWLVAGLVLGVAALTRGNALLFVPGVWLWLASERRFSVGERTRAAVLATAGVVLVLLPVGLRNYAVAGDWVWINSQGGQNFYIGNVRTNQSGIYKAPPFLRACPQHEERDFKRVAEAETGRTLQPSEVSSYWLARGLEEIRADPGQFLRHSARKLAVLLNHYEVPDNYSFGFFVERVPLLRAPLPTFGILLPLAFCGAFFARRNRSALLLLAFLACYGAGIVLFFNLSRLRLPMVPVMILFAGYGAFELYQRATRREWKVLALAGVFLAIAYPAVHADLVSEPPAIRYYNLGQAHLVKARRHRMQAVELSAAGREDEARRTLALADAARDEAEAEYRAGLVVAPRSRRLTNGLRELSLVRLIEYDRTGRHRAAVPLAEALAQEYPNRVDVQLRLGIAYARVERTAEANRAFERVLALEPGHERAAIEQLLLHEEREE